ncbi:MAG: sugar kinase [bacterium]|nr:sugar kinase [bacterium]
MEQKTDIAVIGECLIELSTNGTLDESSTLNKYYGGDTVTTAVTLSRMGSKVSYLSKVGKDGFGQYILSALNKENIDTSMIKFCEEKNGMYIVSNSSVGKELIYYKRKSASARLSVEDISEDYIKRLKLVYSTGVVQSISASSRELVKETFKLAKRNDVLVAYDPNYSSCFMNQDASKECFDEIIGYADIIFISLKKNTESIYPINSIDSIMKYFWDRGVKIVVIKSHVDNGYYTGYNGAVNFINFYNSQKAVDTTASGDVFNGGFLHAILNGYTPNSASKFASVVSGLQTQNFGAIQAIPYKETVLEYAEC